MFKAALFLYSPAFARTLVYMLQAVEYDPIAYLKWFERTNDFRNVMYRKQLVPTKPARMLLLAFRLGYWTQFLLSATWLVYGLHQHDLSIFAYALASLIISPLIWSAVILLPLWLGGWLMVKPSQVPKLSLASKILAGHSAVKIAVAGSYGKTTLKEILQTVLNEGKKATATPGNKNVSVAHAHFAEHLMGDEEVLIIEYGEGKPGDIARFAKRTHPDIGVVTGLAPAHLDRYKSLDEAGKDIFSLDKFVKKLYVNDDSPATKDFLKKSYVKYGAGGIADLKVNEIEMDINGLSFRLGGKDGLDIKTKLLGKHLIGPLVLSVYLARQLGLNDEQIKAGISKLKPYEHRMQPYQLSGAWVIDDTYNGNIEGMKAGLNLLNELKAKRKIYVTPGLVDQGEEEKSVHIELGKAIKSAAPDQVVLIKHTVTDYILEGLEGYKGQIVIESEPLDFYTNLDKFLAAGDLVLMQNDWPDQYN